MMPIKIALVFVAYVLAIWLALMLLLLAVSYCGLSILQACVSVLLGEQLSLGAMCLWRIIAQCQLWGTNGNWMNPVPDYFLVPVS